MIIGTPDGSFFSKVWSELDNYNVRLKKVSPEQAKHLCERSQDYIVFRPLTLRERLLAIVPSRSEVGI